MRAEGCWYVIPSGCKPREPRFRHAVNSELDVRHCNATVCGGGLQQFAQEDQRGLDQGPPVPGGLGHEGPLGAGVRQVRPELLHGEDLFVAFHGRELREGCAARVAGAADEVPSEEGGYAGQEPPGGLLEGGDAAG